MAVVFNMAVVCPKCGEDRSPTMISEINDPMGKRFYCCCCGHEFREQKFPYTERIPEK